MLNKQSNKWSFKICLCLIYHQQMALMIRWYRQETSSCSVFPAERSRANRLKFLGPQLAAWTASIKTISTNTSWNPKIPYPTSIWSYRQLVCRFPPTNDTGSKKKSWGSVTYIFDFNVFHDLVGLLIDLTILMITPEVAVGLVLWLLLGFVIFAVYLDEFLDDDLGCGLSSLNLKQLLV